MIMALNHWFKKAIARTSLPSLSFSNAWGAKSDLTWFAGRYRDCIKDKKIFLIERKLKKVLILDYTTRFSKVYYRIQQRNFKKIRRSQFHNCKHLTLTIDPKQFSSLSHAYKSINKRFSFLIKELREADPNLSYIKTVEFQKSGNPHLHVLLFNTKRLSITWIRRIWKIGRQVRIDDFGKNIEFGMRYILKYITKTGKNDHNVILKWALRSRSFSISRNVMLDSSSKTNSTFFWEYWGCFDAFWVDLPAGFHDLADVEKFLTATMI